MSCAQPATITSTRNRMHVGPRARGGRCFQATVRRSPSSKVSATFASAMARINEHYAKLPASYLFPEIGRRVRAYQAAHPDAKVIRLGIGDVTEPLAPAVVEAMHAAVTEMGVRETFKGYGPEQGYDFLIEAIRKHDYAAR